MKHINKVSQALRAQTPEFVQSEYPLFNKLLEYYYKSQEKTGYGQNILNNFLGYLDIDHLETEILDGKTTLNSNITAKDHEIVVESVDQFLEKRSNDVIHSHPRLDDVCLCSDVKQRAE